MPPTLARWLWPAHSEVPSLVRAAEGRGGIAKDLDRSHMWGGGRGGIPEITHSAGSPAPFPEALGFQGRIQRCWSVEGPGDREH